MAWTRYRLARAGRSQFEFIVSLLPETDESSFQAALTQIRANRFLLEHVEERKRAVLDLTQGQLPGWMPQGQAEVLYALVQLARPSVIVETGVGHGMSTTFLLQGLEDNGAGELYSIDLPLKMRVADHPSGCIVPEHLRHRWHLILGDSRNELPPLLNKLSAIDIFLHDGDHNLENMRFEYQEAWPRLTEGGLLLSDDINLASIQFCDSVHRSLVRFDRMGGTAHP